MGSYLRLFHLAYLIVSLFALESVMGIVPCVSITEIFACMSSIMQLLINSLVDFDMVNVDMVVPLLQPAHALFGAWCSALALHA